MLNGTAVELIGSSLSSSLMSSCSNQTAHEWNKLWWVQVVRFISLITLRLTLSWIEYYSAMSPRHPPLKDNLWLWKMSLKQRDSRRIALYHKMWMEKLTSTFSRIFIGARNQQQKRRRKSNTYLELMYQIERIHS